MNKDISMLALPQNKISILKYSGYHYFADITEVALQKVGLTDITNLTKEPSSKSAFDLYQEELIDGCILTYNEKLDTILKNEIVPKSIVELSGCSGSGKTQICFQLCVSVQLPRPLGGMNGEAIYICTNKNFASHRIKELASNFVEQISTMTNEANIPNYFSVDYIMKHIHYANVSSKDELLACIQYLQDFLLEKQIRLVIIDSISYPIKQFTNGRVAATYGLLKALQKLSLKHNFAVVVTNDLTTRVNEGQAYQTPSLGDSFYHFINTRVYLDKRNSIFHASLLKGRSRKREVYFNL